LIREKMISTRRREGTRGAKQAERSFSSIFPITREKNPSDVKRRV